jgi:hypothetical protein
VAGRLFVDEYYRSLHRKGQKHSTLAWCIFFSSIGLNTTDYTERSAIIYLDYKPERTFKKVIK